MLYAQAGKVQVKPTSFCGHDFPESSIETCSTHETNDS